MTGETGGDGASSPVELPAAEVRAALLAWYREHGRRLPWREESDPYRIWLSEVMLQQTRVDTVRDRFREWLERFPTLESVAEAELDDVLRTWEGLGYYARARNFHRAVREVRDRYRGAVPDDPTDFRALPGVGRYTAGAVLSIAFGRPEPVVDGNVRRVLARWLDAPEPAERLLWTMAERMVAAGGGEDPGALNQAMMELGATVCTPRSPACGACPVRDWCRAFHAGTHEERPRPRARPTIPTRRIASMVIERDGQWLLRQRPAEGLLGGMWEFPTRPIEGEGDRADALAVRWVATELALPAASPRPVGTVRHTFSHFRAEYAVVHLALAPGGAEPALPSRCQWISPAALEELALSRAQRRIAALFG